MRNPADFASILVFTLVAVVFLHRSANAERDTVPLRAYAATALACMTGDVLVNQGRGLLGVPILLAAALAAVWILTKKPDRHWSPS